MPAAPARRPLALGSLALLLALPACETPLEVLTLSRPGWEAAARDADCALPIYERSEVLHPDCREIGDVWVGDFGATYDCGRDEVLDAVRSEACRFGADAAQIVRDHPPFSGRSRCYQVRARFVTCQPKTLQASHDAAPRRPDGGE